MNDSFSDIYIVAFLLLSVSAGGALGTGALTMWLLGNFERERRELAAKIRDLENRYDALLDMMVRERILSPRAADEIKKSTGPLASAEIHIGGDVAGRDKSGH